MADTVNLDNITEYNDEKTVLNESIIKLAGLVKSSKHFIVFTGAGISTSAGINDFRGPNGVWTCKAKGIPVQSGIPITQASPSYAHMALVKLMEEGVLKYVVSQNIDGLHRRSGIGKTHISELHGNCYREVCWSCDNEYLRTYDVGDKAPNRHRKCKECLKRVPYFCHCTGRKCGCGETLKDSIIHFKENLPEKDLIDGFKHGDKADLCLVLGSSLTVSPACHIPRDCVKKGGKLVIVNLQKTPYDQQSELRIFAKIDEVMHALMGQLGFDADQDVVPFGDSKYCQQELTRVKEEAKKNTNTPASASPTSALISSSSGHSSAGFSTPNNRLPVHNKHTDKGGAVIPRYDCPHMSAHVSDKTGAKLTQRQVKEAFASGCAECKDESENWICRQCGEILCGRYVNEHMVLHAATTQHLVVTSLSDLQTWCYGCEAYCIDSRLDQGNAMLYLTKFGALPPGFAKAAGTSI